jgi:hypothetical protein
VQGAVGAVNRNRRHNSVATMTIGLGITLDADGLVSLAVGNDVLASG